MRFLITGGAGSIGSELCLEILKHQPKKVFILDISEISLVKILDEIKKLNKFNEKIIIPVLGDCTDKNFLLTLSS